MISSTKDHWAGRQVAQFPATISSNFPQHHSARHSHEPTKAPALFSRCRIWVDLPAKSWSDALMLILADGLPALADSGLSTFGVEWVVGLLRHSRKRASVWRPFHWVFCAGS
jgi:hypothetical protein